MTKKTFEDNEPITFDETPAARPALSLIPEMTCGEAGEQFELLREAGRIPLGDLLMVMSHLASEEMAHEATCPFHQPGSLELVRRTFREIMS